MTIPSFVLAAGWIPFVIVIVLTVIFSAIYIRYYMSKYDSELSTTLVTIMALTVTLLTSAIVPVDIFLVSYMKESNGEFKSWANESARDLIEQSVLYGYYTLYALVTVFLFIILPFFYFFYEEKDESTTVTCRSRCCSALKYEIVFVVIIAILLVIGAVIPNRPAPNKNETEWKQIEALFSGLDANGIENSLSFVISVLSLFGMLALIMYTAYGMSALPIDLIRGRKSAKKEKMEVSGDREERAERRQAIKNKYGSRTQVRSRDQQRISAIDEQDHLMDRQLRHLEANDKSCLRKCMLILRPFEMVFGILFLLVALLIFISLLLTNIDKAMNSKGYKIGYALAERKLPNPIDIALVFCQMVFPLDYILMTGIILYFVFCSMSGIRNIGIWFLWIKMYKIRPRRTRPQGLLMLCMILMFIVLAINIILYELTPQYSTFGSQKYIANITSVDNVTTHHVKQCSTDVAGDCVVTRMVLLLTRFFYKMWFFGAAYYWGTWLFLAVFLIGFFVAVIKRKRSSIDGEIDDDDFDESDDESLLKA